MQLAFYRGKTRLFNILTAWWTRGPFSHCELIVGYDDKGFAECWSASFMDGGVRRKMIELDPAHWVIVPATLSPEDEAAAVAWFAEHNGKKYDTLGLVGFLWRPFSGSDSKWFCSEALAAALGFQDSWRFCPNTLHASVTRKATFE